MATLHRINEPNGMEERISNLEGQLDDLEKGHAVELERSNRVLRRQAALLELAHDAILVRDMDARIRHWNGGAEKLYGWKRGEAIGKVIHELLNTKYPIPLSEIEEIIMDIGEWQGELIQYTRENTPVVVESRWALQRDESGTAIAVLEINRDITDRKIAESLTKDYQARLEKTNQELRDFAFIASHDLREPLRKLSVFSSILEDKFAEVLGKEGMVYLEKIRDSGVRMQELIDSLLMYSRVTTKAEPFVWMDLGELVNEVILDLEIPIQETGAEVEIGELPRIQADPGQIRQLLQNLIGNALKFHKDAPRIKIYGETCWEASCKISVEDNGIGFDESYLDQIFQPFRRLHGQNSLYKGSGMGLAICRKIVDRHNGTITARSVPGEGSTFIITLPLKQCGEHDPCAA